MTRSNLYIKLSNGSNINCVVDSSSAPEQQYIVETLLFPLLALNDVDKELAMLTELCTMHELRANATYRYLINLQTKVVHFFEESYDYKNDKFSIGNDLTHRYLDYIERETDLEKSVKERFKNYSNRALVARVNSLPDFKWDDEGVELLRRCRVSNGAFDYEIRRNTLVVLKDNSKKP